MMTPPAPPSPTERSWLVLGAGLGVAYWTGSIPFVPSPTDLGILVSGASLAVAGCIAFPGRRPDPDAPPHAAGPVDGRDWSDPARQVLEPLEPGLEAFLLDLLTPGPTQISRSRVQEARREIERGGRPWSGFDERPAPDSPHAHPSGRVVAAFVSYRDRIDPDVERELGWLRGIDRRMWSALSSVARMTALDAGSGAFLHWKAEVESGGPLREPSMPRQRPGPFAADPDEDPFEFEFDPSDPTVAYDFSADDALQAYRDVDLDDDFVFEDMPVLTKPAGSVPTGSRPFRSAMPQAMACAGKRRGVDRRLAFAGQMTAHAVAALAVPLFAPIAVLSAADIAWTEASARRASLDAPSGRLLVVGSSEFRAAVALQAFRERLRDGRGGIVASSWEIEPEDFLEACAAAGRIDDAVILIGDDAMPVEDRLDLLSEMTDEDFADLVLRDEADRPTRTLLAQAVAATRGSRTGFSDRILDACDLETVIARASDGASSTAREAARTHLDALPGYRGDRGVRQARETIQAHDAAARTLARHFGSHMFPDDTLASCEPTTSLEDIVDNQRVVHVRDDSSGTTSRLIATAILRRLASRRGTSARRFAMSIPGDVPAFSPSARLVADLDPDLHLVDMGCDDVEELDLLDPHGRLAFDTLAVEGGRGSDRRLDQGMRRLRGEPPHPAAEAGDGECLLVSPSEYAVIRAPVRTSSAYGPASMSRSRLAPAKDVA